MSGAYESPVGATVEWYTPPALFERLGIRFDLDPASPGQNAVPWVPAEYHLSSLGTHLPWFGRVWLNPPYGSELPTFVRRMCEHGNGLMLTAARTETRWWQMAARSADMVCFLRERLHFVRADGYQARSSFASTLFSWGRDCNEAVDLADLGWLSKNPIAEVSDV